jgi:hypothetical protein
LDAARHLVAALLLKDARTIFEGDFILLGCHVLMDARRDRVGA